jgi:hypothetical protein
MVVAHKKPRNPFSSRNVTSQSRHALPRSSIPTPQKHATAFQQLCYAIVVGSFMVTLLSWAVPVANPTPTRPNDLHQALMLSEKTPREQEQHKHAVPRRSGGIRGQAKLVNLQNLPESVLANTNNHSSNSTSQTMHAATKSQTQPQAQAQADADANEWDSEDSGEQIDPLEETATNEKVSSRWIYDTKERVRKFDASMHASIEEGVFGRERTDSDPIRIDGNLDSGDSSSHVIHVSKGLDEVHVVGGLNDSLDGSRSDSVQEKEQPGGPDEESSSQNAIDEVHVVGGISNNLDGSRSASVYEKEQPGGPDEESSSQDGTAKFNEVGGISNNMDGTRRDSLHEKEQPGGPDEESSSQDATDEVHVVGGTSNNIDESRRDSLHGKQQPGGPDESSSQDTAEAKADAQEKGEERPNISVDGKHEEENNKAHRTETVASRVGESDAKQEAQRSPESILPAPKEPASAQQTATDRERMTTQEDTSLSHKTAVAVLPEPR